MVKLLISSVLQGHSKVIIFAQVGCTRRIALIHLVNLSVAFAATCILTGIKLHDRLIIMIVFEHVAVMG